jgi:hypothetical protein
MPGLYGLGVDLDGCTHVSVLGVTKSMVTLARKKRV